MATKQEKIDNIKAKYQKIYDNPVENFFNPPVYSNYVVCVNGGYLNEITLSDSISSYIEIIDNVINSLEDIKVNKQLLTYLNNIKKYLSSRSVNTIQDWVDKKKEQEESELGEDIQDDINTPDPNPGKQFVNGNTTSTFSQPTDEIGVSQRLSDDPTATREQKLAKIQESFAISGDVIQNGLNTFSKIQNNLGDFKSNLQNNLSTTMTSVGSSAGKIVGGAMGTATSLIGEASNLPQIILQSSKDILSYAMDKQMEAMKEMIKPPTDRITYWTTSYFSEYMQETTNEVLDMILKSSEDRAEEKAKKNENKKLSNYTEKITYYTNQGKEQIDKYVNIATGSMENLNNTALAGPKWLNAQMTKYMDIAKGGVGGFIEKEKETVETLKENFAMKMGEAAARKAANIAQQSIKETTKNTSDSAARKILVAITKAKTAIQAAIMQVLGLLGG